MNRRVIRGIFASLIVLAVASGVASCTQTGMDEAPKGSEEMDYARKSVFVGASEQFAVSYLKSKGIDEILITKVACPSKPGAAWFKENGIVSDVRSQVVVEGGGLMFPPGTPVKLYVQDCSPGSDSGSDTNDWYPAGYSPLPQDPSFAIQWVSGAASPCGGIRCSYWTINIVSQNDCSGGVYVELNMMDSAGTVFDWSNDRVASLSAGQVAQLQFLTYEPRDRSTGQVANVSCN